MKAPSNIRKSGAKEKNIFLKFFYAIDYLLHLRLETVWSKLKDNQARLSIVAGNMKEGVILFDKKINVVFINDAAKKMLKIPIGEGVELVKKSFSGVFKGVDIDKCFSSSTFSTPFIIPEIDSVDRIFQLTFSKIDDCDDNRSSVYDLLWIEDITESKSLERQKSEFVSVVAHQLRTPLSGLKWTLHMLISGDFGELTGEQKVFLMKSYENNERMINLVNDMLAADRIDSSRTKFERMKINLRDLVENVLFEIMPVAEKRKIRVDFSVSSDEEFSVSVDSVKIRAVIQNLLENAIKYTKEGGVVKITIERRAEGFQVMIKDGGIGIPEEQKPQIFSKFFRASNAIKIETSGSGLGLYMVKKIIEAHGGKVWFESEENKGSAFYFILPIYNPKL